MGLLWGAAFFVVLERFTSLRRKVAPIEYRWLTNVGLLLLGVALVSLIFPASLTQVADSVPNGLIGKLQFPLVVEAVLLLLILDFWHYWEHRVFHEVPLLWRAHLVHHSDTAVDVTTARRHHPFEVIVSTFLAFMLMFALGFSAAALGFYLLIKTPLSLLHHANIALPEYIDKPLRAWLVTPSVHVIHHSSYKPETDSNYGGVFTLWDRLFGTYTAPDAVPSRLGLACFRDQQDMTLLGALLQPFRYRRKTATDVEASSPVPIQRVSSGVLN